MFVSFLLSLSVASSVGQGCVSVVRATMAVRRLPAGDAMGWVFGKGLEGRCMRCNEWCDPNPKFEGFLCVFVCLNGFC